MVRPCSGVATVLGNRTKTKELALLLVHDQHLISDE